MNRDQPDASDAPTIAMLRGAKNSASRSGVTSCRAAARPDNAAPADDPVPPPTETSSSRPHPRLLGQAQGALGDDVALDLVRARVDAPGPAGEEDVLPAGRGVFLAVRPDQRVGALDADRDLAELLVILAPEQLVDRRLRTWPPALREPGQRP